MAIQDKLLYMLWPHKITCCMHVMTTQDKFLYVMAIQDKLLYMLWPNKINCYICYGQTK